MPAQPVQVRASAEDLAAALDALLQNVFAHTADGVGMTVSVTADRVLVVQDDGTGFTNAPERGVSAVSTGLGLDIARRTAEASGGSMSIDSDTSGTEIRLTFGPID